MVAAGVASAAAHAQRPLAVRQLGKLERVSAQPLASAASALPMPGGRVLVNDLTGRRLLLFDSTLARATVVADTTSVTNYAYTGRGSLIRYRGDTALFVEPTSLSMLVIGPSGAIVRVMAFPPAPGQGGGQAMLGGGMVGIPGFDARGRLHFFGGLSALPGVIMLTTGIPILVDGKPTEFAARMMAWSGASITTENSTLDSAFILRADLATRVLDTVGVVRIPKSKRVLKVDAQGGLLSIETTPDPLPVVDTWTITADGTLAMVRGRDYHVDWLGADGRWTSSPKMSFDWQRVSDERKETLIDSTVKAWQKTFDEVAGMPTRGGDAGGGSGRGGGPPARGNVGTPPGGGRPSNRAPLLAVRPALTELPDYFPPFDMGAAYGDADGNLWIRTTTIFGGQPVYDIVNRRGELFDRVQLPSFRTIAGFGPGVIFMAVKDSAGVVRLERARIK
jgi:hypothetical protein